MKWQPKRERDVVRPFQERVASSADHILNSHWCKQDLLSMRRAFGLNKRRCAIEGCHNKATTQEHMIDIVSHKSHVCGVHSMCNLLPLCLTCNEAANFSHGYKKCLNDNNEVHDFFLDGPISESVENRLSCDDPCKYEMYLRIHAWLLYCQKRNLSLSYNWKREHTISVLNTMDACWKEIWRTENVDLLKNREVCV